MELELVRTFVEVADRGGFTSAARSLGVPRSSVSRRVARLEERIGAQLFHRTTRRVRLTSAGEALHARVAPALAAIDQAVDELPESGDAPSGRLRVTLPHDLAVEGCTDALAAFVRRYPEVDVELRASSRQEDLVAEGFDAALRAGPDPLPDTTLRSRRLAWVTGAIYAAPGLVQRLGRGAFESGPWVEGPLHRGEPSDRAVRCDDMLVVRAMVRAGLGVGFLPDFLARRDVLDGTLVRGPEAAPFTLYALYPPVRPIPVKLRGFVDYLVEWFRGHPLGTG